MTQCTIEVVWIKSCNAYIFIYTQVVGRFADLTDALISVLDFGAGSESDDR
jgi:hypothetical protein